MWWEKSADLDAQINHRFGAVHRRAAGGELSVWRTAAKSSLAEVIVLDQFSRNIYRNKPASFAFDPLALALAQTAIEKGFDKELSQTENSFLYLPFMHSESRIIHEKALQLYTELGNQESLEFALKHKAIVDRFGRYPTQERNIGAGFYHRRNRVSQAARFKFLAHNIRLLGNHRAQKCSALA